MTAAATRRRRSSTLSSSSGKRPQRTYVEHNYQDHYNDPIYVPGENDEEETEVPKRRGPRGGVVVPFPERLYNMLSQVEDDGFEDVVSWQPHGRCFIVHQPKRFVEEVMPKYFRQSKLTSFQRQVNLYGFRRLTAGTDRGAYYHELFLRGRPDLYKRLVRIRVKGTGIKSASSPATEPNFYSYPKCVDNGAKRSADAEVAMPPIEPLSSSRIGDIQESSSAKPMWKPLSAPPKMMVVTPQFGPIDRPISMESFHSIDFSSEIEAPWKPNKSASEHTVSLSSMAKGIVCGSLSSRVLQDDPCPVTPETPLRQLVSNELEEALAMVSPDDSPDPSLAAHQDILAFEPEPPVDYRMDSFQEGIQALLAPGISDVNVHEEMFVNDSKVLSDDALDPLFLLDEVVSY